MRVLEKLSSSIINEIRSGLSQYNATVAISQEQVEDEIIDVRMSLIKQLSLKNILPLKDLMYSLNCVKVDCKSLEKCCDFNFSKPIAHFEIPQIINDFGEEAIFYIGAIDKSLKFKVYTNPVMFKNHKYKSRRKNKPYVYIDTTPNEHNMYDGYIFNAPMLEVLTVIAVFKDPRQLEQFACCDTEEMNNMSWLDDEIRTTIVKRKLVYYRQLLMPPPPNDQMPR